MQLESLFDLYYASSGVCTDTRNIQQDSLFICLKGANFNGNTFASQALINGAKYVIVDEEEFADQENIFIVQDCLIFLQELANYHRKKFSIPVIGITGSNGKTSSKELIKAVLETKFRVLATVGNLNNHIGVPLTLLQLKSEHEIAVIEMGANKFKDIEELCAIAEPTLGIITNIGKAHLEGFINFDGVLKTKLELYASVAKNKGKIIVNKDDAILINHLPSGISTLSYGTHENATVRGKLVRLTPYVELEWSNDNYHSSNVSTQMIGKYNFYNFLAAIAFGIHFSIDPKMINEAISKYSPTNNRSQVKETASNTLILDCYNANPSSMQSALESFSQIEHSNKRFILGDMLELGTDSLSEHQKIIDFVTDLKLEGYFVGPIFTQLLPTNEAVFATTQDAASYFEKQPKNKCLILLKGSRGIGLEKLEDKL